MHLVLLLLSVLYHFGLIYYHLLSNKIITLRLTPKLLDVNLGNIIYIYYKIYGYYITYSILVLLKKKVATNEVNLFALLFRFLFWYLIICLVVYTLGIPFRILKMLYFFYSNDDKKFSVAVIENLRSWLTELRGKRIYCVDRRFYLNQKSAIMRPGFIKTVNSLFPKERGITYQKPVFQDLQKRSDHYKVGILFTTSNTKTHTENNIELGFTDSKINSLTTKQFEENVLRTDRAFYIANNSDLDPLKKAVPGLDTSNKTGLSPLELVDYELSLDLSLGGTKPKLVEQEQVITLYDLLKKFIPFPQVTDFEPSFEKPRPNLYDSNVKIFEAFATKSAKLSTCALFKQSPSRSYSGKNLVSHKAKLIESLTDEIRGKSDLNLGSTEKGLLDDLGTSYLEAGKNPYTFVEGRRSLSTKVLKRSPDRPIKSSDLADKIGHPTYPSDMLAQQVDSKNNLLKDGTIYESPVFLKKTHNLNFPKQSYQKDVPLISSTVKANPKAPGFYLETQAVFPKNPLSTENHKYVAAKDASDLKQAKVVPGAGNTQLTLDYVAYLIFEHNNMLSPLMKAELRKGTTHIVLSENPKRILYVPEELVRTLRCIERLDLAVTSDFIRRTGSEIQPSELKSGERAYFNAFKLEYIKSLLFSSNLNDEFFN